MENTKLIDENKKLIEKMSILFSGFGYSIAQWLYDHSFCNISICIEPKFDDLIKLALLPIKMHDGIKINNYFTTSKSINKIVYNYINIFGSDFFCPLNLEKLVSDETVVYISPKENNEIKSKIEKMGNTFLFLPELLDNALYYILLESHILKHITENPGVSALRVIPPTIKQDKSDNAKKIIEKNISYKRNYGELKANRRNSEHLCDYIKEDLIFTNEDWYDMLYFPNIKSYINEKGYRVFNEKKSKCVNIVNGHRLTTSQPGIYDHTIYIFGDCNVFGVYCTDDLTMASNLQKLFNKKLSNDKTYRIENYGHLLNEQYKDIKKIISSINAKKGDIIILYSSFWVDKINKYSKFPILNLSIIDLPENYGILFCDNTIMGHPSPNLHRFIAEKIFNFLCENNFLNDWKCNYIYKTKQIPILGLQQSTISNDFSSDFKEKLILYKEYLSKIRVNTIGRVGAIVMNCNPFTSGHRYLIEYASSYVKYLFVFIVEEDLSFFPFKDRMELVKSGTSDLKNVTVLPSGEFIVSKQTFSDYFQKASIQEKTIDPSMDIEIFANEISPALGITIRFAGEEPIDRVTKQYNDSMMRILPKYGIEFHVIKRKEIDGNVISASIVRKLMANNDLKEISQMVPKSTFNYLNEKMKDPEYLQMCKIKLNNKENAL